MALSAGTAKSEGLQDAIVLEALGITWEDYQSTPQEVISYRLAYVAVTDEQAAARAAAAQATRGR